MTPYIEYDHYGDITVRDADTNKAICYMPSTSRASGCDAKERKKIERFAKLIVTAINEANP